MNSLIYGSCAAKHWYPEFRIPNDLDIISKEFYWIPTFQYILDTNKHNQYIDPEYLYTIKVSHASWDIHWDKTIKDIAFLKAKGCKLNYGLYVLLLNDWKSIHRKKSVKLNVQNSEFFKKTINRVYDHDWLHEQLSFYDRPLHEKIRYDLSSPQCSEKLFKELSPEDQLKVAIEEIRVIATERFLLNGEPYLLKARYKAYKQLVVSMTTGWFNLFLIENCKELLSYEVETWKNQLKNILN